MSRRVYRTALRAFPPVFILLVLACGEQSPTRPLAESGISTAQGPASQAALEAQISGLINALYAPTDQGAIVQQFAQIKAQLASRRTADAQASIVTFVQTLLGDQADGDLQDPNGTQPPSTAEALQSLVNTVAQFGGLAPPIPPALGGDQAVAVVGPAGGTVVTETGFGGVQFPAGALPANVIVVVSRLPNPTVPNAGPLPTTFNQFPLFYDFSTTPPVAQFAQPVLVGICQLEVGQPFGPPTQLVANRLQIAHPNPANPTTVELLAREPAPFVDCGGVSLAQARQRRQGEGILASALGTILDLGTRAAAVFLPTPLYAVHGGLGGKTTSFSPFGAVDPGPLVFTSITAGDLHTCGITVGGRAYCWGLNTFGQLGDGTTTQRLRPVLVAGTQQFRWIGAGSNHTCALTTSDQAFCWGGNLAGALGDGTTIDRAIPGPVAGGHSFASLSVGSYLVCGITSGGASYCWGAGGRQGADFGGLGAPAPSTCSGYYAGPTWPCSTAPIQVTGGLSFVSIRASLWSACGLTSTGNAYCWGWNNFGQLGNGTYNNLGSPGPVSGGLIFQSIDAGAIHACGIVSAGAAHCWGARFFNYGQIGDGTVNPAPTPTPVSGGLAFRSIRPSKGIDIYSFTCGVTTGNAAYCWGSNTQGQLGAATTQLCELTVPCSVTPIAVGGGLAFDAVTTGAEFACGVTTTGQGYCWGQNFYGQLGDGTTTNRSAPTTIVR